MTVLSRFFGIAVVAFAAAGPASADIVFADNFNRQASNAVGNGWVEQESEPRDVSIVNRNGADRQMQLQDFGPQGMASQLVGISTLGYSGIVLSYEWAAKRHTDGSDQLLVEWRNPALGADWSTVASHLLVDADSYTTESYSLDALAAGVADFELRFRLNVNANNDGAYVDNVVLTGTRPLTANEIPEPQTLALVVLALGLLGPARRWRSGSAVQSAHLSRAVGRNPRPE